MGVSVWVYGCISMGVWVYQYGCMGVSVWVYGCAGDCVYVRSDQEKPFVARIDRMWTDTK